MSKQQLPQIKIFLVRGFKTTYELEIAVNQYVIETFNKEGNYPSIKTNSKFISVINSHLVDVLR